MRSPKGALRTRGDMLSTASPSFRDDRADGPWPPERRSGPETGPSAAADLEAIDQTGVHGPAADLRRTTVQAGIAALDGRGSEAVTLFRVAREGFRDIGLPWEEALLGIDMATLLDPREPEVVAAAERSREILTGLRARPFLERLEAAMAVDPAAPGSGSTVRTARPAEAADRTAV